MRIEVEIEALSAICVGSTADVQTLGVDKATARDGDQKLIIPGSSLKGVLRWECERIARALGWEVCEPPSPEDMCPYYWYRRGVRGERFCDVCLIFGTASRPSPLTFSDAVLKEERFSGTPIVEPGREVDERRSYDSQVRPGVSISRTRRVAFGERLFFTETSAPNARFKFVSVIEGEDLEPRRKALLLAGVRSLSLVGGGRSRGLGWVRVARCVLDGREVKEGMWEELLRPLEVGG